MPAGGAARPRSHQLRRPAPRPQRVPAMRAPTASSGILAPRAAPPSGTGFRPGGHGEGGKQGECGAGVQPPGAADASSHSRRFRPRGRVPADAGEARHPVVHGLQVWRRSARRWALYGKRTTQPETLAGCRARPGPGRPGVRFPRATRPCLSEWPADRRRTAPRHGGLGCWRSPCLSRSDLHLRGPADLAQGEVLDNAVRGSDVVAIGIRHHDGDREHAVDQCDAGDR